MSLAHIAARRWRVLHGDSLDMVRRLPCDSFDSMVTDPPAGIGFMGSEWDSNKGGREAWIDWLCEIMIRCTYVLKPGAHILVWAIPRTSHWTATAIERAGFEVRDIVHHHFGTGFPKSLNPAPGLGTALKPATEHWILARKPLPTTLVKNLEQFGCGALNIDLCRIAPVGLEEPRWPANLVLTHSEQCALVHVYETRSRPKPAFTFSNKPDPGYDVVKDGPEWVCEEAECPVHQLDAQAGERVSDFFYVAKPSRHERDLGCSHLPFRTGAELVDRAEGSAGLNNPRAGAGRTSGGHNLHPTVKSWDLMRWLLRLVTPPGGHVLDPFCGSGSTGCAALMEGFRFTGIELSQEYCEIAAARIGHAGYLR